MSNYSLGFKAGVPNNSRALEYARQKINRHKKYIQCYNNSLMNAKDEHSQKTINGIIDTYKDALHRVIIEAKLLKKGYNPDKILTEREQLKTLAASGDKAAFRELVKKEAEKRLHSLTKELDAGKITDAEFAEYKQMVMEDAQEKVIYDINNATTCLLA